LWAVTLTFSRGTFSTSAARSPAARVVLEVLNEKGKPDPNRAQNLRQRVANDGMLARVPSKREYEFLRALHKERRHNNGIPIT
jgi:hypothetical protein